MRLINSTTLAFHDFPGTEAPKYAILSHTWDRDETSFQQLQSTTDLSGKNFAKIRATCRLALQDDIDYVWIDTCCIDKSSSAELTEAINSMFGYYRDSAVCYAFLSDLDVATGTELGLPQCRWFTRGWTLQELIAPKEVRFFDSSWEFRGTKKDLIETISRITDISAHILQWTTSPMDGLRLSFAAEKMSWSSKRTTTRVEDSAYCLLGMFDINMPLLYGEGTNAFRRLQEEILTKHGDLSILAWRPESEEATGTIGVLAKSPSEFQWMRDSKFRCREHCVQKECALTSRGLRINFRLRKYRRRESFSRDSHPPYFLFVMDLGFWAETPHQSQPLEDASDTSSSGIELVSVGTKALSRATVVSFGIVLRKYGPLLYCRDLADPVNRIIALDPFTQLETCPTETAFLYTDRDYAPLAYWNADSQSFTEVAVYFPKNPDIEIVRVANGAYWDASTRAFLCWHDLSHISADWDIITLRPSLRRYNTEDILLLVGPTWLPAHTRVSLLEHRSEQTKYLFQHISELYGVHIQTQGLHLSFEANQSLRTMDKKWIVSCSSTRKIVEGISQRGEVLYVELSISPAS